MTTFNIPKTIPQPKYKIGQLIEVRRANYDFNKPAEPSEFYPILGMKYVLEFYTAKSYPFCIPDARIFDQEYHNKWLESWRYYILEGFEFDEWQLERGLYINYNNQIDWE